MFTGRSMAASGLEVVDEPLDRPVGVLDRGDCRGQIRRRGPGDRCAVAGHGPVCALSVVTRTPRVA